MFTGIIRKISTVEKAEVRSGSALVSVKMPPRWKVKEGDSISINGICSTVRAVSLVNFKVEYMEETLKKTTASNWKKGMEVNLEMSLKPQDLLDGHIVLGHVDTTGKIINIEKKAASLIFKIKIPARFGKFIAEKGSVTLDGVSLTVVSKARDWFTVSLVAYTIENTNFKKRVPGEQINVEVDVLAKYLDALCKDRVLKGPHKN